MRFALMTEPQQGLTYEEILGIVRTAEDAGFEAYFRSDHYVSFPGDAGLPTTDAWATLAGLARETSRINLGTLVSPVTFRLPGNFAKLVTTVDEMSRGRIEVGMGAGWNELEHKQLGLRFPDIRERYDMFEEALAIIHGLWTEPDGWSFPGKHWQIEGALFQPKPVERQGRRHPNLIVGGDVKKRMARLAATYADEVNLSSARPATAREAFDRVRQACEAVGRDPGSVTYSAMTGVLVGASEADVRDRVKQLFEVTGWAAEDGEAWLAERRGRWIIGTPDEAQAQIAAFEAAGVERLMLQDFLPRDLDMVRYIGESLLPSR